MLKLNNTLLHLHTTETLNSGFYKNEKFPYLENIFQELDLQVLHFSELRTIVLKSHQVLICYADLSFL